MDTYRSFPSSSLSLASRTDLKQSLGRLDERNKRMKARRKELKNKETLKVFLESLDDLEINNLRQLGVFRKFFLQLLEEKDYDNSLRILQKLANVYQTSQIHHLAIRVDELHTELDQLYPFYELSMAYADEEYC
jgi:hypothetical protein